MPAVVEKQNTSAGAFKSWLVVMSASLLFFYAYIQINCLNSIDSDLMNTFSINAAQLGTLSAMYFYANFIMVFPAGLLLDRFSARKLILMAMIVAVLSMFGFAFAPNATFAGAMRFIMGISGGFCFISNVRLASRWFKPQQMALVIGCVVTMSMFGGMIAQTPVEILAEMWGWRGAMIASAILGILFTIIIWLLVQDKPADYKEKETISSLGFWHSIRMVILNKYNWFGGVYTALMNLPIFLLGALWGGMYLVQADHLTHPQAAMVISMLFLGAIFGSPFAGWISDRLRRRILPMIVGAMAAFIVVLIIIYFSNLSQASLLILFFLLGFISGAQSLSYPTVTELNSSLVTASANSIISTVLMASGFIFQPFFGWLMDLHWNHLIENNVPVYSLHDFRIAVLIMPIAFLVSLCAAFLIKETHCQRVAE